MTELANIDVAARPYCTFRLQQRLYGIDVRSVREVSPMPPITPVPQAPTAIRGLVNLRSHIYLAIDLGVMLGMEPAACTSESRLVILKPETGPDMGLLVEHGGDIVHVKADQIESAGASTLANAETDSSLIAGVCKLEMDLMMIIDAMKVGDLLVKLIR